MRKTLSVLVSVIMIASLFVMGVNAAEGTAINSADDFMVMEADGTYYLNADITLTATFDTTFTGTLDGNGHTVTISAPMFKQMNGTVKNLTIEGTIESTIDSAAHVGAVATNSKGGMFEKITNKANISVTVGNHEGYIGGLVGRLNGADHASQITDCVNYGNITGEGGVGGLAGVCYNTDTVFENCVNYGEITNTQGAASKPNAAGGIIGYSGSGAINLRNCTNNGAVVSSSNAGGIAGDTRKSSTIANCVNNADVKGGGHAGGIVGYSGGSGITIGLTVTNCINNGDVTGTGGKTGGAAGIAAYAWASDSDAMLATTLENCINNGNIHLVNKGFASEFVAYTNSIHTKIVNCIGTGSIDIKGDDTSVMHVVFVGLSSSDSSKYTVENIFMADGSAITHYSWSATEGTTSVIEFSAIDGKDLSDTAKAITRGSVTEIVKKANAAIGAKTFAVTDGKVVFASQETEPVDTTPDTTAPDTTPDTDPVVTPDTDPVTPDTDPVVTPDTTTEPAAPETGDNAIIVVAAVAVVALIGVCLIGKKKVTD